MFGNVQDFMIEPRVGHVYQTNMQSARVLLCVNVTPTLYFGRRFEFFVLDGEPYKYSSLFRVWFELPALVCEPKSFTIMDAMKQFQFDRLV